MSWNLFSSSSDTQFGLDFWVPCSLTSCPCPHGNPGTFFYRTCAKLPLNRCPAALAPSRVRFAEAPLVVSPICSFLHSCSEGNTPGVRRGGSKSIWGPLLLGKKTLGDAGLVVVLSCRVTANTALVNTESCAYGQYKVRFLQTSDHIFP